MSADTQAPTLETAGRDNLRGLLVRLMALVVALLLLAQGLISFVAIDSIEKQIAPQVLSKADVIGQSVAEKIAYALELGIPLDRLVGMEIFLETTLRDNSDLDYLTVINPQGNALYHLGASDETLADLAAAIPTATPSTESVINESNRVFAVVVNGAVAGYLVLGINQDFVRVQLRAVLFDVFTVLLVSLLVALEFLVFYLAIRMSDPLRLINAMMGRGARGEFSQTLAVRASDEIGRLALAFNRLVRDLNERAAEVLFEATETKAAQIKEERVGKIDQIVASLTARFSFARSGNPATTVPRSAMQIRIPLFIFMFSEELSRTFMPLYIQDLYTPILGLSKEVVIGLPIALFMAAVAVMTPMAGHWTHRYGARRVFLLGIVPAVIGYIGTFAATDVYDLLLWRGCSAVGYGLIFIAAQSWVAENAAVETRARDMSIFVGAVFAAAICGPAIGGILADRVGFSAMFLLSALLAAGAGLIVYSMLEDRRTDRAPDEGRAGLSVWLTLLRDPQFLAVSVFAAIPAKLVLTGFLFYLVPLFLTELGNSQSNIGRIMMVYGLVTVAVIPFASRLSDRWDRHAGFVLVGGLVAAAAGGILNITDPQTLLVLLAVVALGIGHGMSLPSQLAIVQPISLRFDKEIGQAKVISSYRLIERVGAILGPLVAGALSAAFGFQAAIAGTALVVLVGIVLFAVLLRYAPAHHSAMERPKA